MTTTTSAPDTFDMNDLNSISERDLATEINAITEKVHRSASKIKSRMRDSLIDTWKAGQLLLEAKRRRPGGSHRGWLKINCPKLDRSSASRWMRLAAQVVHVDHLDAFASTRHAYLVTGIMKQPKPQKPEREGEPVVSTPGESIPSGTLLHSLHTLRENIGAAISRFPMEPESAVDVTNLAEELDLLLPILQAFRQVLNTSAPVEKHSQVKV